MSTANEGLARAHGLFYVVTGLWPLVHIRSFEAVTGPKVDRWLVYTVGGLLGVIGATQAMAGRAPAAARSAKALGVGTAATLLAVDVIYASRGRIARIYLADAAMEAAWLAAWAAVSAPEGDR